MCTGEQLATLYHEAGHAVVGRSVGMSIVKITIDKSADKWRGQTVADPCDCGHAELAKYYLAGGESELSCNSVNNILYTGQADDQEAMKHVLELLDFPEMTTLLSAEQHDEYSNKYDSLRQSAKLCIDTNWNVIERIVEKLRESDTLEGEELTEILSSVSLEEGSDSGGS